MSKREDVDLWLILTDPKEARRYIADFDWGCPRHLRPDQFITDSGRVINFRNMTDEDAVVAASAILREVECPMIMRDKQYAKWEH